MTGPARGMTPQEAQQAEAERILKEAEGPPPIRGAAPEGTPPPEILAHMQAAQVPVPTAAEMATAVPVPEPGPLIPDEVDRQWTEEAGGGVPQPGPVEQMVAEANALQRESAADLLAEAKAQLAADEKALQVLGDVPKTFSVSLIGWSEKCMLAAKMSRKHDPGGELAELGTAIHEVLAALDFKAQMEQREHIPEAEALAVAERVLRNVEDANGPLTRDGYFALLSMVGTWAATTRFTWNGLDIVEHELPVRTELDGAVLTGRIDRLEIEGTHCRIRDYKTGGFLPSLEDMKKRTQTPIYAWHVRQMYPQVLTFDCIEEYLRYGIERTINLNAYQVDRMTDYLSVAVARIKKAFLSGEPDPTPGSHCTYCPSSLECPLPETRRLESAPQDHDDAKQMADELIVLDSRRKEIQKALRAYFDKDAQGHVWVGDIRVGYEQKPKREMDKKALASALASGTKADPEDFYSSRSVVEFSQRKRKETDPRPKEAVDG